MLAGMIHLMRGTPYIYQGEEIGMPNAHYSSIEQYQDVESLNYYEILLKKGKTKEEALATLAARSRDNSRTPMQWNEEIYGGFSDAKPWLPMSAGFRREITMEAQQKDDDSILAFYKKLIAMRKTYPVIAKGAILFPETQNDMVLAYTRTLGEQKLVVLCNLSGKKQQTKISPEWSRYPVLLENSSHSGEECPSHKDTEFPTFLEHTRRESTLEQGICTMKPYEFLVLGTIKEIDDASNML